VRLRQESRILVVDDDPEVARTFEVVLHAEGYDVLTASEGETAVAIARRERVDAALLDLAMPGMDGMAVLEALRRVAPRLPVIVVSAYVSPEREAQARRLGARHVLAKPPEIGELLRLCSEVTHATSPASPAARPARPARR
jgi:CheY-like chemotaxis protein